MAEPNKPTAPSLRKIPLSGAAPTAPTVPLGAKPVAAPQKISTRKPQAVAPPADLIARVTASRPPVRTPQLSTQPGTEDLGLEANVPMLEGQMGARRIDGGRDFDQLTQFEQNELAKVGITPDMKLPANMATALKEIKAVMDAEELPLLQNDPTKPFVVPQAVDISQRSPEHQARLAKILGKHITAEADAREEAKREAAIEGLPEGAEEAFGMADAMARGVAVDDVTQPAAVKPPAKPHQHSAPSETGADAPPQFCEHCHWPIGFPDIPEPAYEKKLAFLQCALGEQTYKDEEELLGGNLTVAFRTLTTRELQAVFYQAFMDLKKGRIETKSDHDERLNWYRLCLQLMRLQGSGGMMHVLPDGMSPDMNDLATAHWECDDPEPGETILPQIASYIETKVLKTEQIFRMVSQSCHKFNRVVAKLEANLDNSDFWKPTAGPS